MCFFLIYIHPVILKLLCDSFLVGWKIQHKIEEQLVISWDESIPENKLDEKYVKHTIKYTKKQANSTLMMNEIPENELDEKKHVQHPQQ
jgi:hypothetical protein